MLSSSVNPLCTRKRVYRLFPGKAITNSESKKVNPVGVISVPVEAPFQPTLFSHQYSPPSQSSRPPPPATNQACRLAPRAFSFLTALLVSRYRAGAKPGTWVWCTTPDPFPCWPFWAWPVIHNSKSSSQMVYGFCMSFHGQNDSSVNYANNHCAVTSFCWSVSAKHSASVVSSESHHNSIACVLVSSPFCKRGKRVLEGGLLTLPSPLPSSGQLGPWRWAWIWSPKHKAFF